MPRTKPKSPKNPMLRVAASPEKIGEYRETAHRFGYEDLTPFVRRLLDAAKKADPQTGLIQFFRGSDRVNADQAA